MPNLWLLCVSLQILQELEKQRIEVLCNILNRYHLQMTSFGQTLNHVRTRNRRDPDRYVGRETSLFAACRDKGG